MTLQDEADLDAQRSPNALDLNMMLACVPSRNTLGAVPILPHPIQERPLSVPLMHACVIMYLLPGWLSEPHCVIVLGDYRRCARMRFIVRRGRLRNGRM